MAISSISAATPTGAAYTGSLPFATALDGYPKHKLLKYYYPPDPDRLDLRKQQRRAQPLRGYQVRRYDDVVHWHRVVHRAVARANVHVKRIFEMQKRDDVENLEVREPPRVALFVRPAGSFLTWKQCLEPTCDVQWSSYQDLSCFAIEGKGKGNE
ncbi:hypothetical protein BDZ45DRAFT_739147 [Acephala macrosclerotiorum]|nr:hypothetical protein BDZ45DRAFT_739147 [Acephala macrosclerotiorum]